MANLPVLESKEQILGKLITGFLARVKTVNDITRASIINQFFSAIAQSNFKAAADVISMIDAMSVDRASGEALQRLAKDADVVVSPGTFSTSKVTITDNSFVKVFTNVFAGQPAPVAGSTKIYVVSAANWDQTGKLFIGRGTPNVEGPLNFVSVQQEANGAYWSISLDPGTPTTKFHNLGEEIVEAKGGNRVLTSGTLVRTPPGSAVTSVDFSTVSTVIIPDGEVTYSDIPIVCKTLGTKGNVPRGAISEAVGLPFTAAVFNNNAIVNGLAPDDDDSLRKKIKNAELKKSKGTEKAIEIAAIGVTSDDDQKQVVSSNVVRYSDSSAALIFDDGSGYEPIFAGVGLEQVIDQAIGGEKEVQLRKRPVTPALVKTISEGPYSVPDQYALEVVINDVSKTHFFPASDFKVPSNQQPFEIVSSINGNPNIHFLASTADGGTKVVIYPKDRTSNDIKVNRRSSNDANDYLDFPVTIQYALLLYKNDDILYEDGRFATVSTRLKSTWSTSIANGDTLTYKIDNTPEISVQFTTDEFQQVEISATVNAFTDIDIWIEVMNRLMTGVIASKNGEQIDFTSARGENDRASIEITGGTLKDKIFTPSTAQESAGRESDYTLNKQTGQVGLKIALGVGDKISAGSQFTHAKVTTTQIPDGPTAAGHLWMVVDGDCSKIESGLQANTNTTITKTLTKIKISCKTPAGDPVGFDKVLPGDWILLWAETADSVDFPSMNAAQGFWRVESVVRGEIIVDDGVTVRSISGTTEVLPTNRMVFTRSSAPMQKLSFSLGTISNFINEILDQIIGVVAEIVGSTVRISTETAGANGQLLVVAADSPGKALGLTVGTIFNNIPSHRAFVVTEDSEAGMPSFSYSTIESENSDTEYVSSMYEQIGGTRDDFIELLPKYIIPSFPYEDLVNVPDTNQRRRIFVKNYDASPGSMAITVDPKPYMTDGSTPMQAGDRYYLRTSYQFDSDDTVTAVIDGDSITKGFGLKVARRVIVNSHSTPTMSDFSADDGESSLPLNDPSSFSGFNFEDFKVWRKSNVILTDGVYYLKVQANGFGPAGNKTRVGFVYPKSLSQTAVGINVTNSETIDIGIILPVKTPRTPNWDGTTAFTVDVTNLSPGKDRAKFTWQTGTQPNFLAGGGGANVNVGDIAMIDAAADFLSANKDIQAKVTNVNATDFTIELPSGKVTSDNVVFGSLVNLNKTVTVITTTPHGISSGDLVGIFGTEKVDGVVAPLDGSYFVNTISPTIFTYTATNAVPGKAFTVPGATHNNNVITINANAHGLFVGNVVLISNVGSGSYDGIGVVRKVNSPNQFTVIRQGSSSGVSVGRFDFESYGPDYNGPITTLVKSGGTVTATATAHGLVNGDLVDIFGTTIVSWVAGTYSFGDTVEFGGLLYKSKKPGTNTNTSQPDITPSEWAVTTEDLSGRFIVQVINANTFSYILDDTTGSETSTGATFTRLKQAGKLARSIGSSTLLSFADVSTTAQAVSDALTQNYPDLLTTSIQSPGVGTEVINSSTEDLESAGGYLAGTISNIETITGSRLIKIEVNVNVPAGATIKAVVTSQPQYSGTYAILSQEQVGLVWKLTAQSAVLGPSTATLSITGGTFTGGNIYDILADGENSVLSTNLDALTGTPTFTVKRPWNLPPSIGEELRLVSLNTKQLTNFWNRLVVTGLANVTDVQNSEYGRQIEITTNTFGANGSVQIVGGNANNKQVAIIGSGTELSNVGVLTIPFELRKGINEKNWLRIEQTVRDNKIIGLQPSTYIQTNADGIQIISGAGSFQTKRTTTQNETSLFKVEKHGNFIAIINIGGQALGLTAGGVVEGDWVRFKDTIETAYDPNGNYVIGDRVLSQGFNFTAMAANGIGTNIVNPVPTNKWDIDTEYALNDTVTYNGKAYRSTSVTPNLGEYPNDPASDWELTWEVREWSGGNTGIFQVVRVFGDNSFWIENVNGIEELLTLGNTGNLSFYSYDSIMPGDTLVVSSGIFGDSNISRFTVRDETFDPSYSFPTASRIWTDTMVAHVSTNLGDAYVQVNIEEANPVRLWKRVFSIGPAASNLATIIVDSPNLMNRISSSNAAFIVSQGKLSYDTVPSFGIDAYKYYQGLIQELNKVIYGDPTDPINYEGIRAAGTDIDIKAAIVRRVLLAISIRVRTGIPFSEVRESVKAAAAGYVNNLETGEQVSLSKVVEAVSKVNGVVSVVITYPTYNSVEDQIAISPQEKALIQDPTNDVTVSILGT